jgi:DNA-binding transcriptional LysR family regulator
MYNRQLNTFLKVAEHGSFNRAAESLYVSPSAVIQQINGLERDLGIKLFLRSRHGLRLTAAGEYLAAEVPEFIQRSDQIRERLLELDNQKPCIVVGTTMEEKCRLLYDLWILFTPGNTRYDIRLEVAIDRKEMPRQAQLVESIQDGAPWQKDWQFLEFFRSPLRCGVVKEHPLAGRRLITLQDLRENGIVYIDRSASGESECLREVLKREQIPFESRPEWTGSLIWECSIQKRILVVPSCWNDILVDLLLIPCELDVPVPYGFFYRDPPSAPLAEFLDFVRDIYHGTDPDRIIPVL